MQLTISYLIQIKVDYKRQFLYTERMRKVIAKLTGLKLLGSIFGLGYSILQIRLLGANAAVDAFFVATTFVYLVTSLLQGGQLSEIFLPEYLKQRKEFGTAAAHQLLSAIITRLFVIVSVVTVVLYLAAPLLLPLMGPGLDIVHQELSIKLFYWSLPLLLFTVLSSFTNTTLNAEQIFGRAEITQLISALASTIILVIFYKIAGVFVLVYALLLGKIIEFSITLYYLNRIGYTYKFTWNLATFDLSIFFKAMGSTSAYVGVTQISNYILTAMASFLPPGILSLYNYVQQLSNKGSNILLGPAITVFFSKISENIVNSNDKIENLMEKATTTIWSIFFVVLCLIFLLGDNILHILWSARSLTSSDFEIAYLMLVLNFVGVLFFSVGQLFRKVSIASGDAEQLYRGWILVQVLSAIFAYTSIRFIGFFGLAFYPVVNMILMAIVPLYYNIKSGIDIPKVFASFNTKLFAAMLLIVFASYFIREFSLFIDADQFVIFIVKFTLFSLALITILFALYNDYLKLIATELKMVISAGRK